MSLLESMNDDLVDVIKPGDRIAVTGVYRAIAPRVNPRARTQKSVFRTYIDVIHIGKEETRQFAEMLKAADEAEAYTEGDTTRAMVDARVQELKALAEADDDDYLHSAWADTKALKNSLQGISGGMRAPGIR